MRKRLLLRLFSLCFGLLILQAEHLQAQTKKFGKATITEVNGNISEGRMRRGKKHGEWKTTSPAGVLLKTEHFHRGVLNGPFVAYYETGQLRETRTYVNGRINGTAVTYLASGDTLRMSTYRNDTLHGYYGEFREWQDRMIEGYYVNGHREGMWTAKNRVFGSVDQIDTMHYHNDSLDGAFLTYRDGYLFEEANYSHGVLNGADIKYQHGQRKISEQAFYRNGLREGVWSSFNKDGVLIQTIRYQNGKWTGSNSSWHVVHGERTLSRVVLGNAGKKTSETYWRQSRLYERRFFGDDELLDSSHFFSANGAIVQRRYTLQQKNLSRAFNFHEWNYDEQGRVINHGEMNFSEKNGPWMLFDSTGRLKKEITYDHNVPAGLYTSYYPDGKIKVRGICIRGYLYDSIAVFSAEGKQLKKSSAPFRHVLEEDLKEHSIAYLDKDVHDIPRSQPPVDPFGDEDLTTEDDSVLTYAEQMPMFPGDSSQAYFAKNIRYPLQEKEEGKEGTVYVQFTVEKNGSITNAHTVKGVTGAPAFAKEAERIIKQMPDWRPGRMNGEAVRVQVTQPIRFRLN